MASFNKVMLMGNLTRDIEIRPAGSSSVGNFGLAVNRKFKTQSGEQREEVAFIDCECWGRTAEVMAQYLNKGNPVFVEGRLKFDTWEDRNGGGKRSKLSVVVENFQFLSSGGGNQGASGGGGNYARSGAGGGGGGGGNSGSNSGGGSGGGVGGGEVAINHDDIPF